MSNTTFGFEIEQNTLYPSQLARVINNAGVRCIDGNNGDNGTWRAIRDGSVSNGGEAVSPILTRDTWSQVNTVMNAIKSAGVTKPSIRAGLHVHVGVSDITDDAKSLFILNWYYAHGATNALLAPSRLNNRYCVILNERMARMQAERPYRAIESRYVSLNVDAYREHTTYEARTHHGTLNGTKALAWASYVDAHKQLAVKGIDLTTGVCERLNGWTGSNGVIDINGFIALSGFMVSQNVMTEASALWLNTRATRRRD